MNSSSGLAVTRRLAPFALVIWLGFLAVGVPLPVLPVFAQNQLGATTFVVGLLVGAQSFATLFSRAFAASWRGRFGPKPIALAGLVAASVSGLCYFAAASIPDSLAGALAVLFLGRLLLGVGESMFITASVAWSIACVGTAHAGRAMSWSGIAMYGALAIGAPFGIFIDKQSGFAGVAICTVVAPLVGVALTASIPSLVAPQPSASYFGMLRQIWPLGLSLALASSGIGTISAFLALYYDQMGWLGAGSALTAFGCAYLAMRLFFAGLPDRIGGVSTALASLFFEALGLIAIWCAPSPIVALLGAAMTGLGYSLVFPSLGVEALKVASPESRGQVLGIYFACFDLGVAMAGPVAGTVADRFGLTAVFPAAACAALLAFLLLLARVSIMKTRPGSGELSSR